MIAQVFDNMKTSVTKVTKGGLSSLYRQAL